MIQIKSKKDYIYIFAFLFIIYICMLIIVKNYLKNNITWLSNNNDNSIEEIDSYDNNILALYEDESDVKEESVYSSFFYDFFVDKYSYINVEKNLIEKYAANNFDFYQFGIVFGRYVQKFMGLSPASVAGINDITTTTDIVINLGDEYLAYVLDSGTSDTVDENINSILSFSEYAKEQDRNLVVLEAPTKMDDSLYEYEDIYIDYTTEFSTRIAETLRAGGVSVLSIDEKIEEENLDKLSLFFKTDHHWLPQTGIWACGKLSEYLNEEYEYNLDTELFNIDNYNISYLDGCFLGSQGRKVTSAYCVKEDFPVVTPLYDTNLTVYMSETNQIKTGTIQETLLNDELLTSGIDDTYNVDMHRYYGYGGQVLIQIHNNNVNDGSHILIIKDSMANSMYTFFSAAVEYLDILDLRVFEGSLKEYIEDTEPDMILIIYGVSEYTVADDGAFDFE